MLGEERDRAKMAFCADLSAPPPERVCGRLGLLPRGGQWGNPWPPLSGRGRNPQVSSPPPWCAHGHPLLARPSEGGGGRDRRSRLCPGPPPFASLIPRGSLGGQTGGALHGAGRGALRSRGLLPRRANRPPWKSFAGPDRPGVRSEQPRLVAERGHFGEILPRRPDSRLRGKRSWASPQAELPASPRLAPPCLKPRESPRFGLLRSSPDARGFCQPACACLASV